MTTRQLTAAQEKRLNRLHLCGDASGGPWGTIVSLAAKGLIDISGTRPTITDKGRDYCRVYQHRMPV